MESMDAELTSAGLGKEFTRAPEASTKTKEKHEKTKGAEDVDDMLKPMDVNLNLVKHLLESYSSQAGQPGPTSSLLGSLGITLPDDADRSSSTHKSNPK
mmetsp:Transcript_17942/g.25019  ORF Transcript_17942/g.25019 Transcript_17942/m.25019 type:complete len:99 (-) Transcript_17942:188-484(-)